MKMKYFYDTEFIDDSRTIDLISIGMICEDGREYYAVSTEFNRDNACLWVRENVIDKLQDSDPWKTRETIKHELIEFCDGELRPEFWTYYGAYDWVAMCQLFGTMMDLPLNWPKMTKDIKQLCDFVGNPPLLEQKGAIHHALNDARWVKDCYYYLIKR